MSTKIVQLDMFGSHKEAHDFKKNVTNSIRGLFARYNEVEFQFLEMYKRLEKLEAAMYQDPSS